MEVVQLEIRANPGEECEPTLIMGDYKKTLCVLAFTCFSLCVIVSTDVFYMFDPRESGGPGPEEQPTSPQPLHEKMSIP